ncbi:MAG: hypothetical protein K6U80_16810 [Firmicutes bacterium]|nr:hypothetical protein [Bacillota bacterium]
MAENQATRRPGMNCPECGFFIEISIPRLLGEEGFICPGCGLYLLLNRQESRESLEALNQLQVAIENFNMVRSKYS